MVVKTSAEKVTPIFAAVHGGKTAMLWCEGRACHAGVADAAGAMLGTPVALTGLPHSLRALGDGFVVLTMEDSPTDKDALNLRARTLGADGTVGEPTDLVADVFNSLGSGESATRGAQLMVIAAGPSADGLAIVTWTPGTAPMTTPLIDRKSKTVPVDITPTADGYAIAWRQGREYHDLSKALVATVTPDGKVAGITPYAFEDKYGVGFVAGAPMQARLRGRDVELRSAGAWTKVAPQAHGSTPDIVRLAGRSWVLGSTSRGVPVIVVPLADDGSTIGAGFTAPSQALDHDGTTGAVLSATPTELRWHPLACAA